LLKGDLLTRYLSLSKGPPGQWDLFRVKNMNKYFISVDIEGITGVVDRHFADLSGRYHDLGRKYLISDVNAVISGILSEDPNAFILVRDAHGDAVNIDLEKLNPRARLIQGWGNEVNMLSFLDQTFNGVFLVGYHAGGDNNQAVLGHTYSSVISSVKINGQKVNEAGIFCYYAGCFAVPVVFLSGDDQAVKESKQQFGERIITAEVKKSLARDSVLSLSLSEAAKLLSEKAALAVKGILKKEFQFFALSGKINIEIGFYNLGYGISIFEKLFGTLGFDQNYVFDHEKLTVEYQSKDFLEGFSKLNLIAQLVYGLKK
jgi:D-amino peptidase